MPIHFEPQRWSRIRRTYQDWWERNTQRPVMKLMVPKAYAPARREPKAPLLSQGTCTLLEYTPEQLIDRLDYELEQQAYLGDGFPYLNFDCFGPGVLAAFCGAKLDNSSGGVWFFPQEIREIEDIHIRYDPDNLWARRVKDLYRAGNERWQGQVLMGMVDLGGVLDVIATFRESENLLMDLYDAPEEVLRLCEECHQAWMDAYRDLNSVLQPVNPGYSDWSGIYSEVPSYILQSDFTYMIGTPMFDTFALPWLRRAAQEIEHTIYHLDGAGEVKHLEHLLELPQLDAVQWVWGDGTPSGRHWVDLYEKIAGAGKGIYLLGADEKDFDTVMGRVPGCYYMNVWADTIDDAKRLCHKYGVEE